VCRYGTTAWFKSMCGASYLQKSFANPTATLLLGVAKIRWCRLNPIILNLAAFRTSPFPPKIVSTPCADCVNAFTRRRCRVDIRLCILRGGPEQILTHGKTHEGVQKTGESEVQEDQRRNAGRLERDRCSAGTGRVQGVGPRRDGAAAGRRTD
jgi:hypothetical protein